mmetsp:Transcript_13592/g.19488  ORF Transcript_13592/g.19488 Transcript_13592/m.19488 type:complete len:530 (+) Transcript_13592:151-1740(+)
MDLGMQLYQSNTTVDIRSSKNTEVDAIEIEAAFTLALSVLLMCCSAVAYQIKERKLYFMPDSAGTILVGVAASAIMALLGHNFSSYLTIVPGIAFYALLPLIVFEAGYCFECSIEFMQNLFPILMYATIGAMISTFIIGYSVFYFAKWGLITSGIDTLNPMEALMFGALISATDPVATLSIMGNKELHVDGNLYSLVFGESVLNDAVSIVLFKTFEFYYNQHIVDFGLDDVLRCLLAFCIISASSIFVGLAMGLIQSYIYKNSNISNYPKMELSLLFLFCYCTYSVAQILSLSGIMALFVNGIVVSHYNAYNLSPESHSTSEHVFSTMASLAENLLFLCMGLFTFSGLLTQHWNMKFALWGLLFCFVARGISIGSISWVTNLLRPNHEKIAGPMQAMVWWAGLRGGIAFALSMNMPGPNKDTYASVTLSICFFTTFICGGLTDFALDKLGMKQIQEPQVPFPIESTSLVGREMKSSKVRESFGLYGYLKMRHSAVRRLDTTVRSTAQSAWQSIDTIYLRPLFGGDNIEE